jgi:hypothetical protein
MPGIANRALALLAVATVTLLACCCNLFVKAASDSDEDAGMSLRFPAQFYVNIGTTIPIADDPVAQSGSMYVDLPAQMIRIDNFWHGNSRTFVADMTRQRGYVINNGECKVLRLTGRLRPYGVPQVCLRDDDLYLVRGVSVVRYSGVEHGDYLQQVDYFVRNATIHPSPVVFDGSSGDPGTAPSNKESSSSAASVPYILPWRILSRRSHRKELRAPPVKNVPNWRFFGEPMDELVQMGEFSSALETMVDDVPITVDFYNFVPAAPDPHVFMPPTSCAEPPTEEFSHDVDIVVTQRLLVDLSFNTAHGRRVMERLWNRGQDDGAAADGAAGAPHTGDL